MGFIRDWWDPTDDWSVDRAFTHVQGFTIEAKDFTCAARLKLPRWIHSQRPPDANADVMDYDGNSEYFGIVLTYLKYTITILEIWRHKNTLHVLFFWILLEFSGASSLSLKCRRLRHHFLGMLAPQICQRFQIIISVQRFHISVRDIISLSEILTCLCQRFHISIRDLILKTVLNSTESNLYQRYEILTEKWIAYICPRFHISDRDILYP